MKVGIVGAGAVGSACLLSIVMRGSAREVVLVNRDRKRAQGVVTDVQYGTVLSPPIEVRDGDYSDLAGSSLVMITAGVNEKGGGATDRSDPVGGSACSRRMLQSFRISSRRSTAPLPMR
jgi:L-lactate dehydrogenase